LQKRPLMQNLEFKSNIFEILSRVNSAKFTGNLLLKVGESTKNCRARTDKGNSIRGNTQNILSALATIKELEFHLKIGSDFLSKLIIFIILYYLIKKLFDNRSK